MARNPNSVVIGPEGELYKCWNDVGDATRSYGNINGDINNESVLLDYLVKADYLNNAECNRCIFFTRCDGGCPYERIKRKRRLQSKRLSYVYQTSGRLSDNSP